MTHNQVAYFQANNDYAKHLEEARHNREQERISGEQAAVAKLQALNQANALKETARHNRISEQLGYYNAEIQKSYNAAQLAIANANLLLAGRQQDYRESTLTETTRHNYATEQESYRHATATEGEVRRQNMWTNLLGLGKIVSGMVTGIAAGLLTKKKSVTKN